MFERFTDRARKAMAIANQEAGRLGHDYIGSEHILLGVIRAGAVGANVLKNLGVDPRWVCEQVDQLGRIRSDPTFGKKESTPRAKAAIEHARQASEQLGHNYIGTEHLLLGLLADVDGIPAVILREFGVTPDKAAEETLRLLGDPRASKEPEPLQAPQPGDTLEETLWDRYALARAQVGSPPGECAEFADAMLKLRAERS